MGDREKTMAMFGQILQANDDEVLRDLACAFLEHLYTYEVKTYLLLSQLLAETVLVSLSEKAQQPGQPEIQKAAEAGLSYLRLGLASEAMMSLRTARDSEMRERQAWRFMNDLRRQCPLAALALADYALDWLEEVAKKGGLHGISQPLEEIGRLLRNATTVRAVLATSRLH